MGSAAGVWLGRELTRMYMEFFKIPGFQYQLPRWIPPGALLLCLSASLLGVTGAVRRAARLPPAEAMRPEAPANYGPSLLERLGLGRTLGMAARMVARNLERRPFRSIFAVIGIALATSVLVLGSFIRGTIEYVVDVQFQGAQRQDYTLTLTEAASDEGLSSLRHLPGIVQSEPVLAVPVRISAKHRERRITLTGVPADRKLYPLLDMDMHAARIVPGALVVSKPLAEAFGVGPGDPVQVEVLTGERKTFELKVGSLLNDFAGLSAYMEREELGRRIGQPDRWSAAFVRVDRSAERDFVRATHETPLIAAVSSKRAGLESFRRTFAENILRMRFFNVMFATIIACGVVYNTARIALSERSRELATLRVIGFNRREISTILLGEVGALVFAGLAPGMVLGYGFAALAVWFLATESQRFPLIVTPQTFAFAATVVLLAAIASGLWVRRGLDRLDLVAVLKARD
jgi:putative ABC transport system permease protein